MIGLSSHFYLVRELVGLATFCETKHVASSVECRDTKENFFSFVSKLKNRRRYLVSLIFFIAATLFLQTGFSYKPKLSK